FVSAASSQMVLSRFLCEQGWNSVVQHLCQEELQSWEKEPHLDAPGYMEICFHYCVFCGKTWTKKPALDWLPRSLTESCEGRPSAKIVPKPFQRFEELRN